MMEINYYRKTVHVLYELFKNKQLSPFNEKDAWVDSIKNRLVKAILLEYPIPSIIIMENKICPDTGKCFYFVLDGFRCLKTIVDFIDNKLPLPDETKQFYQLDTEEQRNFWSFQVPVTEIRKQTKEIAIDIVKTFKAL